MTSGEQKAAVTSAYCGCGARFAHISGPTHRYMASSPGCWAAFGEVLTREYSDPAFASLHRLSVDAYAIQHPGLKSGQSIQSVAVHLCRLCVILENGYGIERANDVMLAVKKLEHSFRWLQPPHSMGAVTVANVRGATQVEEHLREVNRWARSAWEAWSAHHATIRSWLPSGILALQK